MSLDYNEIVNFMKDFKADFLNRYGELIIDEPTNTYAIIGKCKDISDVELYVVFALCRPIGKGLEEKDANRLLNKLNNYFNADLSRGDLRLIYRELCYVDKLDEFKDFIRRGFPMEELSWFNA
ncbi:hypothetical protein [Virgibacillus halodenitrificans]|uniref:hypothetical protein n=1 Tax=Virgibacillus halodenitrificans TaxID=1482 RepID=UPI000EF48D00|nr:hypothetical protein [Virgibacillus halodenitrificans]